MQNFEMEKYKKLNEEVLDDENNLELIDIMKKVGTDLVDTVNRFKAIAKAKGIRYEIAAAKKDAITKQIMDGSENTKSKDSLMAASKSKTSLLSSKESNSTLPAGKSNRNIGMGQFATSSYSIDVKV